MANVIRFLSYNVQGLCDYKKRCDLLNKMVYDPRLSDLPHVIFFQDTQLKRNQKYCVERELGRFDVYQVYASSTEKGSAGLLTAIHKGLNCEILHVIRDCDFILLHCTIMEEDYLFVNLYFRPFHSSHSFLSSLQRLWAQVTKFNVPKIILGGDFNAVLDPQLETLSHQHRKSRTCTFSDFIEETHLSDPWRVFNPDTRRYTWFARQASPHAQASRLDRFLLSDLAFNYCWDAQIQSAFRSDHCPITLQLLLNRNDRGKGLFRFPDFLCSDDKYKELLAEDVKTFAEVNVNRVPDRFRASPAVLWDTLKAIIRGRTIKFLARRNSREAATLKSLQDQINDLTALRDGSTDFNDEYDIVLNSLEKACHDFDEAYAIYRHKAHVKCSQRFQVFGNVSSSYFFRKVRGIPGAIRYLFRDDDTCLDTDEQILEHCKVFYDNLYTPLNSYTFKMSNFSKIPRSKRLDQEDITSLEQEISPDELFSSLQKMRKNSSPGFDGLTVSFYLTFWSILSPYIVANMNYAHAHKRFSLDQRRGVVKMLPKKNKAPSRVGNLRPITLLNVDYKMITKALAQRVKHVLPKIIHVDQAGFVANRFLGSHVLDVQTLVHVLEHQAENENLGLLSLDICKAFDTVDWGFLRLVLRSYGFPPYFLNWIVAMQEQVELRVLNNGHLSSPISVRNGVAQGCSLSPYLFILVIETLAEFLRSNTRLKGFTFGTYQKIISLVADDCLLTLEASVDNFIELHSALTHFSAMSGLQINFDKSVFLHASIPDGLLSNPAVAIYKHASLAEGFAYLGTRLGDHDVLASNFVLSEHLMKDVLKSRPLQKTSLSGRILQIKTLVASRFVYKFMLLPTPSLPFLKLLDKEYYDYIWEGGRHKLNKQTMVLPRKAGGFNMLNVFLQEKSLKLVWLNRFLSCTSPMTFTQYYLFTCTRITTLDFLRCNLSRRHYRRLFKYSVPVFLLNVLDVWFERKYVPPNPSMEDDSTIPLLLNSLFCFNEAIGGISLLDFQMELYLFLADNNLYLVHEVLKNSRDISLAILKCAPHLINMWNMLILHVPETWQNVVISAITQQNTGAHVIDKFIQGSMRASLCRHWLQNKTTHVNEKPISKWASDLAFTVPELTEKWNRINGFYSLAPNPVLQDFHILFMNRAYHMNTVIHLYRPEVSPLCTFCKVEQDSYLHAFYDCRLVKRIWIKMKNFYREFVNDDYLILTPVNCLLSDFECNLLSLIVKRRIFLCKINDFPLDFATFIVDFKRARDTHWIHVKNNPKQEAGYKRLWSTLVLDSPFDEQLLREVHITN